MSAIGEEAEDGAMALWLRELDVVAWMTKKGTAQLLESLPKVGKHGGCGIDAGAATMVSAARGGEGDDAKRGKWRGRLGFVPGRGGVYYPLGAPADGCPVAIGVMDVRPASTGASMNRGRWRWEVGWAGTLCTHGPCA